MPEGVSRTPAHTGNNVLVKLRPHHILCDAFLDVGGLDRGQDFEQALKAIRELMHADTDKVVEIVEGVDLLCRACPECRGDRCESPHGNEEAVRKWDMKIVQGLDIAYGEKKTARELRALIAEKAPLDFCRARCPWRQVCTVFERL